MSGFLYFISGHSTPITDTMIAALELSYALDESCMNGPLDSRETPSGKPGWLLADRERLGDRDLVYCAARQTWKKRPGDDAVYIGFWNDARPSPKDLARSVQLSGKHVAMCDGQRWLVPRMLVHGGDDGFASALPARAGQDDEGHWINGAVRPGYVRYETIVKRLYDGVYRAELRVVPHFDNLEMLDMAADLLSINYAVGRREVGMLELLPTDEPSLMEIGRIAADRQKFEEWFEKKNAESASTTGSG